MVGVVIVIPAVERGAFGNKKDGHGGCGGCDYCESVMPAIAAMKRGMDVVIGQQITGATVMGGSRGGPGAISLRHTVLEIILITKSMYTTMHAPRKFERHACFVLS